MIKDRNTISRNPTRGKLDDRGDSHSKGGQIIMGQAKLVKNTDKSPKGAASDAFSNRAVLGEATLAYSYRDDESESDEKTDTGRNLRQTPAESSDVTETEDKRQKWKK